MNALVFRVHRRIRRDWRSTLFMAMIVAVVGTAVLSFAAGAARTASTPDRYTASVAKQADAAIVQKIGNSRSGEIADLPSVERIVSMTFMMAGLTPIDSPSEIDVIVFAGSAEAGGATVTSGRQPNPSHPQEFVATRSFVEAAGAAIGDTFQFLSLTAEQGDRFGFALEEPPQGPTFVASLVGIVDGVQDGDPSQPLEPAAIFPPSVLDGVDIAVRSSLMAVSLIPGTDLTALRAGLDTLPEPEQFNIQPIQPVSPSIRTAVAAEASGLWVLAAVAALSSVAALGQFASIRARLSDRESASLSAIGLTTRQLVAESVIRASVPVLVGAVAAVVGAYAVSGFFPYGIAKAIEPRPGPRFDPVVLLAGSVVFALAVMVWTWCALAAGRKRSSEPRLSPLVERMAVASPTPTAATGLRFAYTHTRRNAGFTRAAIWGVMFAAAGIIGAVTVGSSLDRLVAEPPRQGRFFDAVFGDAGQTVPSDELRLGLVADPAVRGLTLLGTSQARGGDNTVMLVGFERIRGGQALVPMEGRLPASTDEIALGRVTARELHVDTGDELSLHGATSTQTFTVTGIVVMPSVGGGDGVGDGGLVTMGGLQHLDQAAVGVGLGINIGADAPAGTLERIAGEFGLESLRIADLPTSVGNLDRVRAVPYLLAGVLAALGILTVTHAMFTSVRNRRRDIAVLGALGADRRWVARMIHWQASGFTLLPTLVGVPVGMLLGRQLFRWLADTIGAANDASFPYAIVSAVAVTSLVLANMAAAIPARGARNLALAQLLQPE